MRKYEIAYLTSSNEIIFDTHLAPALSVFEDCFAALGRGALLQTDCGPRAIEDLLPGDNVQVADGSFQPLKWRGTMSIVPGSQNDRSEMGTMTRLTADALGHGRPAPDLVLGPSARMTFRAPGINTLTGSDAALLPVRDFIDQNQIIELTPMASVQVYQIGFDRHELLRVNGVELESLHPGLPHTIGLRSDVLSLLMALFPHKHRIENFGPLVQPRLRLRDLDLFEVA